MGTSQSQEEAPPSQPPSSHRQPPSSGDVPSQAVGDQDSSSQPHFSHHHSTQPHSSHHHSTHHHPSHHHSSHHHHHHSSRHHSPQSSRPHASSRPHSSRPHSSHRSHHHNPHPLSSRVSRHPDYVPLDFSLPSLDRHMPRPRSASGSSGRRHRYPQLEDISSSAPSHSFLLFRSRSRVTCPLCGRDVSSDEFEQHLVNCVSKPRVMYNVDTLAQDAGECSICLDDMVAGHEIARLPCLCVYHVKCLEKWYRVSQTCPEHPESTGT